MNRLLSAVSLILCGTLLSSPAVAADWQIVGVGNTPCRDWNSLHSPGLKEVLAWMTGFASAENLDRSEGKRPAWKLEEMTYDYLRGQIDAVCIEPENQEKKMHTILFELLLKFPQVNG
ncbi:MAG: hypothetical protein IT567_03330 [Alphaproteobacteria bacterium]|nr:hypothetical protein [Alphaproteobacteria bacterium]